ncbi:hypothetical protein BGW38_001070 [Lunasporangiospora selenospora]|uniref:VOC domain-containing protein n=1 Tax=Lunasporangiospora selenospora TaxID=979761 RepID=A0A9P6FW56_9FUNG|nr:hypothetical protein BGW38_001070 [Lunasporangiospora selenospora]
MIHFYESGLGFTLVESFENHRGFDGRIIAPLPTTPGGPVPWHLEFTYQHEDSRDHSGETESVRAPTRDNLLALYLKDRAEVEARKTRMEEHGYHTVVSANPYWDDNGVTFEDPEGWRVVLCWLEWPM